jgi:diguanylate cyclase (GGDEF)-like protein/PAS domain S-box-containing protein
LGDKIRHRLTSDGRSVAARLLLVLLTVPAAFGVMLVVTQRVILDGVEGRDASEAFTAVAISTGVSMLLMIVALAAATERFVMRRTRVASEAIARIARSQDFSLRLPPFGPLADDFNSMMEQLQRATTARAEQEERYRAILANSSDAIAIVSTRGVVSFATAAVQHVWGSDAASMVGRELADYVRIDDRRALREAIAEAGTSETAVTTELHTLGRHSRVVEAILSMPVASLDGIVVNARDVTERVELREQLEDQAFHDGLTALPNRRLFMRELAGAVARGEDTLVLLFLDLDDFKVVNDTLGHAAGDAVLVEVAQRLGAAIRPGDMAARLGGDEFVLLLRNVPVLAVRNRADDIAEVVRRPLWIGERMLSLSASVGIALSGDAHKSGDELLREADAALYRAKALPRRSSVLLDPTA